MGMTIDRSDPGLPEIPLVDCGWAGPGALAHSLRPTMQAMIEAAERMYGRHVLRILDRRSAAWLLRNSSPYVGDIAEIARLSERPGANALNISYEWACTSGTGMGRLWRTLDWPFRGLGSGLVVARHESKSGPWLNVTWPGFIGVLTAMKLGKFAVALNQAPLRRRTGLTGFDWLIDRIKVNRSTDWPPTHVLRRVCESCASFEEAKDLLTGMPMALPALFAIAGPNGRAAIIERQERSQRVHEGPGAIANHWLSHGWQGRARGGHSRERLAAMSGRMNPQNPIGDFHWLEPPILNRRTRLAVACDIARGELAVLGLEAKGRLAAPATRMRVLSGLGSSD
jgi:hypothetical protein